MARSQIPPDENPIGPGETNDGAGEQGYDVGYGKPPRHSRFAGGNTMSKGRHRKSKNLETLFNEAMSATVPVKIKGKTKKVAKREVIVSQLANLAARGDLKAIFKIIDMEGRYGPPGDPDGLSAEIQQRDRDALRDFMNLHHPPGDDGSISDRD